MERKTANDYPQELLNLFDTYVHGGIDRREFLEGAQKFAVGGMTALKAHHIPYEACIYEGANHGFHNDTTPRYDAAAAKLACKRTLDFFAKYLKEKDKEKETQATAG